MAIRIDADKLIIGSFEIKQKAGGVVDTNFTWGTPGIMNIPSNPASFSLDLVQLNQSRITANGIVQSKSIFNTESQTTTGLIAGGAIGPATRTSIVEKLPIAAISTSRSVGNLTVAKSQMSSQSSKVNGYFSGGLSSLTLAGVDRFPFANENVNAVTGSNLSIARRLSAGVSSTTHGYTLGGIISPGGNSSTTDKFPFSSDVPASVVNGLAPITLSSIGISSKTAGYTIQNKFLFSNDVTSTPFPSPFPTLFAVLSARISNSFNSSTDGYWLLNGGNGPISVVQSVSKFPFSSEVFVTVGSMYGPGKSYNLGFTLNSGWAFGSGGPSGTATRPMYGDFATISSESMGITAGGSTASFPAFTFSPQPARRLSFPNSLGFWPDTRALYISRIDAFPFATTVFSSCIGELIQAKNAASGASDR